MLALHKILAQIKKGVCPKIFTFLYMYNGYSFDYSVIRNIKNDKFATLMNILYELKISN